MSVTSDLMQVFGCETHAELAKKLGTTRGRVSMWDSEGMPAAAVLVARDMLDNLGVQPPDSLAAEHRRIVDKRLKRAG